MVEKPGAAEAPTAPEVTEEPESFEVFFREHHARLFGTLCLVTGDTAEAEELVQEAFVRVWERWDTVRAHPDVAGYLYRTAFNANRDRTRRLKRAARRLGGMAPAQDPFARVDERADVLDALRHLSPRQRAAVVLTEIHDLSSEEAGDLLGIRPVTVRVLASQAREALRHSLGGTDA